MCHQVCVLGRQFGLWRGGWWLETSLFARMRCDLSRGKGWAFEGSQALPALGGSPLLCPSLRVSPSLWFPGPGRSRAGAGQEWGPRRSLDGDRSEARFVSPWHSASPGIQNGFSSWEPGKPLALCLLLEAFLPESRVGLQTHQGPAP